MSATLGQEFAVTVAALLADRIDGMQAIASLIKQAEHAMCREVEPLTARLDAVRALAYGENASAVLYGVIGTHPESYGGVTKDEALERAGELLSDLRAALDGDPS